MSESKRLVLIGVACIAIALSFDALKCVIVKEAIKHEKAETQNIVTAEYVVDADVIENAVMTRLAHHKQKLSKKDIDTLVKVVYIGHFKYRINYQDILSMISTESEYYKFAQGKNYKKKKINGKTVKVLDSIDYGLTQQNSKNLKSHYRAAARILKAAGIRHNINDKFDVALNVMACVWYLDAIRKEIGGDYSHKRMISSYNTGVVGFDRWPKKATAYYTRFTKMKSI